MRYYLIAGEASGDLQAAELILSLAALDNQAVFRAWGGDKVKAAGAELVEHYAQTAIMGLGQVLLKLGRILGNFSRAKRDILAFQPDVLILIDYSGFNLPLAAWAKKQGLRVAYYVLPQVWASRPKRIERLRLYTDLRIGILPFEPAFYEQYGLSMDYVGHPLLDICRTQAPNPEADYEQTTKPIVALLPGSRKQEIRSVLPVILALSRAFPQFRFIVAAAPGQEAAFYQRWLRDYPQVELHFNRTYDLLRHSRAAVVVSGTASLEAALFKVPQIVVYRTGALFYFLAKRLIKVPYIALTNLILGRLALPELLQGDCRLELLKPKLQALLQEDGLERLEQLKAYEELVVLLGAGGASLRAAALIFGLAKAKEV